MKYFNITKQWFDENIKNKRCKSKALEDINILMFGELTYNTMSTEYSHEWYGDIWMKKGAEKGYMVNPYLVEHGLIFLDTIHLIHWANWLNIAGIIKRYPEFKDFFFFSKRVEMTLNEPAFINQMIPIEMKILCENRKPNKGEFTMLTRIGTWGYVLDEYTVTKNQFDILEYYHKKHESS